MTIISSTIGTRLHMHVPDSDLLQASKEFTVHVKAGFQT